MTTTQYYDDDYDPTDYAGFEAIEDRDDLADLPLDLEPCESCGGTLRVLGAFGGRVVLQCEGCALRPILDLDADADLAGEEDDEEMEEEE